MARVLIIDDEKFILQVLSDYLEDNGYEVTVGGTLADARRELAGVRPDMLVIDMTLPDGNGAEFVESLRFEGAYPQLPIILMSAHSGSRVTAAKDRCHADDVLIKPFDLAAFEAKIREVLARPRPASSGFSVQDIIATIFRNQKEKGGNDA